MRKYVALFASISYILLTVWELYYAYAPKVGPIGNGPNEQRIWFDFVISMIGGACFITLTVLLFIRDKRK